MAERIVLEGFNRFGGQHCQTTALKSCLGYLGLDLSEEMLLGLGGGIGFIYWYMKKMPAAFVGGRAGKDEDFLANACSRLGIKARLLKTSSRKKADEELKGILRQGKPAFVFVDMAYLPYLAMPEEAHFGSHAIVVYGLDEEAGLAYVSDRAAKPLELGLDDLKKARSSPHPPFPAKNRLLEIVSRPEKTDLRPGIVAALRETHQAMIKPPIKNFGLAGLKKWADLIAAWPAQFKGLNLLGCLLNTFIYIEIGGTGGAAFREMYARFLEEAAGVLKRPELKDLAGLFFGSAQVWRQVAAAALPESWPTLSRMRSLLVEKNRLFEQQPPQALEKALAINAELDELMKRAAAELTENNPGPLLDHLRQKVVEVSQKEGLAFARLGEIIASW